MMKGGDSMSNVFLVTYDLMIPGQKYDAIYERIKFLGDYIHFQDSVWIVKTNLSAKSVFEQLEPAIDKGDKILVINVTNQYWGWSDTDKWENLARMFY